MRSDLRNSIVEKNGKSLKDELIGATKESLKEQAEGAVRSVIASSDDAAENNATLALAKTAVMGAVGTQKLVKGGIHATRAIKSGGAKRALMSRYKRAAIKLSRAAKQPVKVGAKGVAAGTIKAGVKGTVVSTRALAQTFTNVQLDPDSGAAHAQEMLNKAKQIQQGSKATAWTARATTKMLRATGRRLRQAGSWIKNLKVVATLAKAGMVMPIVLIVLGFGGVAGIIGVLSSSLQNVDPLGETQAYVYLTKLDAEDTQQILDATKGKNVTLTIDGEEASPDGLEIVTDFDAILAYESLKNHSSYLVAGSTELDPTVQQELKTAHDALLSIDTGKATQTVTTYQVTTDADTGERTTTKKITKKHITKIAVKTGTVDDLLKTDGANRDDNKNRIDAMKQAGLYSAFSWMQSPNQNTGQAVQVSNRMGYRYRNGKMTKYDGITITTLPKEPVRSVTDGTVTSVSNDSVTIAAENDKGSVRYKGLTGVKLKKSDQVKSGAVIGSSRGTYKLYNDATASVTQPATGARVNTQNDSTATDASSQPAKDSGSGAATEAKSSAAEPTTGSSSSAESAVASNAQSSSSDETKSGATAQVPVQLNPAFALENVTYTYGMSYALTDAGGGGGMIGDLINPPKSVTRWRSLVENYAKQYGISQYVNLLLAFIWEETGGDDSQTKDITQSSESLGLKPNSITSVDLSVKQMCVNFSSVLRTSRSLGLSDSAAVGARNYGSGYLRWLKSKKSDDSFDNMVAYANKMAKGVKVKYTNPIAKAYGSWRYLYGNMFYTKLVLSHIKSDSSSMVEIAAKEIKASNNGGAKFWKYMGFTRRVEWCASFTSWVAHQAHMDSVVPKTASCAVGVSWYKNHNRWGARGQYTPKSGDLIYFDWTGTGATSHHVGIVDKVSGGKVYTVEGNNGDAVRRSSYATNSKYILGYGKTN